MKRVILAGFLVFALSLASAAQKKKDVLVTIGKTPVTMDEFLRIYERNNSNIQDPENKKTAAEYLELFVNFKLKVLEAQSLGMDTLSAFRTELDGYRDELATPYLTNVSYNDKIVEETYQRMKKEVYASHLMISVPENAVPEDTLAAYQRVLEIRKEILGGLDFNEAASLYSQDPSAQTNKGELGWFTVFQMVYPFEEAAYSTPVGEVSSPVRTRFGYHLLKVHQTRDAGGEIHVAHIMKVYPQDATPEQKLSARQAADSIYALIEKGADFGTLASQVSDDQRSAANKGEMPWFSRSRMIPEFADPAFELLNDGDISKPVDSGFGFHIIKRLERRPVPEFGEVKREIEERIKRDGERSVKSRDVFVKQLRDEYDFTRNQQAVDDLLHSTVEWLQQDSLVLPDNPAPDPILFSFAGNNVTTRDWISHLKQMPPVLLKNDRSRFNQLFHEWENSKLLDYEDSQLERKHPEFRSLLQEYHDGILLFNISENKIWQKASSDSAGLARFYETNRQKYMWPERFKGAILQCVNNAVREEAEKYLESGVLASELQDLLRLGTGSITVTEGTWEKGADPVIDYYIWKGYKPENWNQETGFVNGELIAPEPKLLNEARGYHIADYQQYLEDNWVKELRKKYPVRINKKLMKKITNG